MNTRITFQINMTVNKLQAQQTNTIKHECKIPYKHLQAQQMQPKTL